VGGNEVVDMLAEISIKHETVDVHIPISRAEVKTIIKQHSQYSTNMAGILEHSGYRTSSIAYSRLFKIK